MIFSIATMKQKETKNAKEEAFSLGAYSAAAGVEPTANPYKDEEKAEQWLMGWISEENAKRSTK